MNWQEVCDHPQLRDLSFKIELNEDGKIVMSPLKVGHSLLQGKKLFLLLMHVKRAGQSDQKLKQPQCQSLLRRYIARG